MELTPDDRLFLQTICRYFHENGAWPTLHWLEREFIYYQDNNLLDDEDIDIPDLENHLDNAMHARQNAYMYSNSERQISLTSSMIGYCLKQNICLELRED